MCFSRDTFEIKVVFVYIYIFIYYKNEQSNIASLENYS